LEVRIKFRRIGGHSLRVESNVEVVGFEHRASRDTGRFELAAEGTEGVAQALTALRGVFVCPEHLDEEFS
jgi:hypothetical protein